MSELTQPKTYKYKLDAESFVKLFLASDFGFSELKEDMLKKGKEGVKGVNRDFPKHNDLPISLSLANRYTIVRETEIIGDIDLKDIQNEYYKNLLCINSYINNIFITNSTLAYLNDSKGGHFGFNNCIIGVFRIRGNSRIGSLALSNDSEMYGVYLFNGSTMGDFAMFKSKIEDLYIFKTNKMGNIKISKSNITRLNILKDNTVGDINIIEESNSGLLKIDDGSTIKNISIENSTHNNSEIINSTLGKVNISGNSTTGNFQIVNCTTENLDILNSKVGGFIIKTSTMGGFLIDTCSLGEFSTDVSIIRDFTLINSTAGILSIVDSATGFFHVGNSTLGDWEIFDNSKTGDFSILKCKLGKFAACGLYCSFYISDSEVSLLRLDNCNIPNFRIDLSCKLEAYITQGQINTINLSRTTLSKETILSFSGTKIFSMLMEEFSVLGNLYFRQIIMAEKLFDWFITDSIYPFIYAKSEKNKVNILNNYDLTKDYFENRRTKYINNSADLLKNIPIPTICISQSSLGKTEFTDCPLADYKFQYNNSRIIDCFISGGSVPGNNIEIIDPINKEEIIGIEEHKQKASIYNQLKKIFEAQGDLYNATIFQCKWANHQEQYLKQVRKDKNSEAAKHPFLKKLKSYFNENSQDIYILWLNKISNNHGESWLKPLCWLLGYAFIFYIIYLWSIGRIFSGSNFNWDLFGYYFEFLNPLHKDDFIKYSGETSGCTVFINFTSKLFTAFFLYKFLVAFRKHGKK